MDGIVTERIHLRRFTRDDLDDLHRILSDPDVVRYLGTGQPVTKQETETALSSIIRHWETHGMGRWALINRDTGELIGYGGLRSLEGAPELVYCLARNSWGMGLATETARACLEYGFRVRQFRRIVAVTKPENMRSRRVLERTGMICEGSARYYNLDVVQYGLSRESYMVHVALRLGKHLLSGPEPCIRDAHANCGRGHAPPRRFASDDNVALSQALELSDEDSPPRTLTWAEVNRIHRIRNGVYQRNGRLISLLTDFGRINPCYPDRHGEDPNTIYYTGDGRRGDQPLNPANRALLAAIESGHAVPLFNKLGPGRWQHTGLWRVVAARHLFDERQNRMVWQFTLRRAVPTGIVT